MKYKVFGSPDSLRIVSGPSDLARLTMLGIGLFVIYKLILVLRLMFYGMFFGSLVATLALYIFVLLLLLHLGLKKYELFLTKDKAIFTISRFENFLSGSELREFDIKGTTWTIEQSTRYRSFTSGISSVQIYSICLNYKGGSYFWVGSHHKREVEAYMQEINNFLKT